MADGGLLSIKLFVKGTAEASWDSTSWAIGGLFDVRVGDLDSDGSDELVVVDHESTSNGIAITTHNVIIVSRYLSSNRSSLNFEIQEYCGGCGEGTFVRRPGWPGTWIFATEWMSSEVLDPQRGRGNYVVGRWFRYLGGKLVREPGVVVRRYLDSFDRERSVKNPDTPYSWFLNGKGRSVTLDPAIGDGHVIRSLAGAVVSVPGSDPSRPDYVVRLDDGRQVGFVFTNWLPSMERIDHIGLADIGRILPKGVSEDVVIGNIIGYRARIDTYRDGTGEQRVLWIQ
jgi:hypothetical protein